MPCRHDQAELAEQTADLVGLRRAGFDEALPHAMRRQTVSGADLIARTLPSTGATPLRNAGRSFLIHYRFSLLAGKPSSSTRKSSVNDLRHFRIDKTGLIQHNAQPAALAIR